MRQNSSTWPFPRANFSGSNVVSLTVAYMACLLIGAAVQQECCVPRLPVWGCIHDHIRTEPRHDGFIIGGTVEAGRERVPQLLRSKSTTFVTVLDPASSGRPPGAVRRPLCTPARIR